ncbi:MAG: DUF493 domain-containing protein [Pseudomonadota bacterium]
MSDGITIEFPCRYPIKVIMIRSEADPAAQRSSMLAVVEAHAPGIDRDALQETPSRAQNYISYSFDIEATGEPQLKALHAALMARDDVKLVL